MKNSIKKVLCTSVAALTIVSSAASINTFTTGYFFDNSITAEAINESYISYASPVVGADYYNSYVRFNCHFYYSYYSVTYFKHYYPANQAEANDPSLVNALHRIKEYNYDSFDSRYSLAKKNKLVSSKNDYRNRSAEVNKYMLRLLKDGHLIKTSKHLRDQAV